MIPHGEALPGSVEPRHPAGDVATGQIGQEEDDQDGDTAADAQGLRLLRRLAGGVDVLGEPEGDPGRREQGDEDDGEAVRGQPAEEGRPPLDAAETGALGVDGVACGSTRGAGAGPGAHGRVVVVVLGVAAGHGRTPPCGVPGSSGGPVECPDSAPANGTGADGRPFGRPCAGPTTRRGMTAEPLG